MGNTEETIDLARFGRTLWRKKAAVVVIVAVCTAVATALALVLPKQYASKALLQVQSGVPMTYVTLMKSQKILGDAAAHVDGQTADAIGAAIEVVNPRNSYFVELTGKGRTPEAAQAITQAVVNSTYAYQAQTSSWASYTQALSERTAQAKQAADEAAQKLAADRTDASPAQGSITYQTVLGYDKTLADLAARQAKSEAVRDSALHELAQQMRDDGNVKSFYDQAVDQAAVLAGLRQTRDDGDPDVLAATRQLDSLRGQLHGAVNAALQQGMANRDSTIAALIQQQADAEMDIALAATSRDAILAKRNDARTTLAAGDPAAADRLDLKSDAEQKRDAYLALVQASEQAKAQQATYTIGLRTVDEASLPAAPLFPKKKNFAAAGFAIGCLLALGYGLLVYWRETKKGKE